LPAFAGNDTRGDGGEKTPEVVTNCDNCELCPQGSFPIGNGAS
jgi:hypothetical protein